MFKNGTLASQYTYDANGNRLSKTDASGVVTGMYDAQDRLTGYGAATYSFSAEGTLAQRSGPQPLTTRYDELGSLAAAVTPGGDAIEYLRDAQDQRVGKRRNGQFVQALLYQEVLRPIAELDATGRVVSRFIYATGINVPDYMVRRPDLCDRP